MKPSITGYENGTAVHNPDAATLARWALAAHLEACRTCKNEYCPTGQHLLAATHPDKSWIRDYGTEA